MFGRHLGTASGNPGGSPGRTFLDDLYFGTAAGNPGGSPGRTFLDDLYLGTALGNPGGSPVRTFLDNLSPPTWILPWYVAVAPVGQRSIDVAPPHRPSRFQPFAVIALLWLW